MTTPTDNLAIVLGVITPAEWLAQVDAGVEATYRALLARGRFDAAVECLHAHLVKTEVTRTREYGPGPDWAVAVARFEAAVDHQNTLSEDRPRLWLVPPPPICGHRRDAHALPGRKGYWICVGDEGHAAGEHRYRRAGNTDGGDS